jgi:hypothetical protein
MNEEEKLLEEFEIWNHNYGSEGDRMMIKSFHKDIDYIIR